MGKKRFAIVAVVAGVLTIAGYALPLNTTVNVIDIDINVVVLFRAVLPFFLIGLALDAVSTWGRRVFPGKIGEVMAENAERFVPAFIYMVPAEVTYIVLFVALTIHSALVWNSGLFPYFFLPGLLVLPFIFTRSSLVTSIKNTYLLFVDLWKWLWKKWLWEAWYRFTKVKPDKPKGSSAVPWGYLAANAFQVVWYVGIIGVVGTFIFEIATNGPDLASIETAVIGTVIMVIISLALGYLKWKYPKPDDQPT